MDVVYIPTRSRHKNLLKIVPRWLWQDFKVTLVTEEKELRDHQELIWQQGWGQSARVIAPPQKERGIGLARRYAVAHAARNDRKAIIMSDDDLRPAEDSEMYKLVDEAAKPGVLGVGAVRRIHDHFTGGKLFLNSGVILCPGGWGQQVFGLNVRQAIDLGNFDARLDCFGEDAELERQGIAARIPWLVHCDVLSEPIGVRYAPGGLATFTGTRTARAEREIACRRIIHKRWPKYTSEPEARSRMAWQKMLTDYIPEWKTLSAMHGGEWRNGR